MRAAAGPAPGPGSSPPGPRCPPHLLLREAAMLPVPPQLQDLRKEAPVSRGPRAPARRRRPGQQRPPGPGQTARPRRRRQHSWPVTLGGGHPCPNAVRALSGIPGLHPREARGISPTECDNQKCLWTLPEVPWGQRGPWLRTTALRHMRTTESQESPKIRVANRGLPGATHRVQGPHPGEPQRQHHEIRLQSPSLRTGWVPGPSGRGPSLTLSRAG